MIMKKLGKVKDLDRSFDVQYWQAQPEAARFAAAWELVELVWKLKGRDLSELRLQRTIESLQRKPR